MENLCGTNTVNAHLYIVLCYNLCSRRLHGGTMHHAAPEIPIIYGATVSLSGANTANAHLYMFLSIKWYIVSVQEFWWEGAKGDMWTAEDSYHLCSHRFVSTLLMPIHTCTLSVLNLCFTSILVVMSHESNANCVFASQGCLRATCVCVSPRHLDQLNAKDADMEKALLSCDISTNLVLVKQRLLL